MFPSLIILIEYICANLGYGFPWVSFSLIYSNNFIGTSLIFFIGTYGLSFLTISFFLLPYVIFFPKKNLIKYLLIFYLILFCIVIILTYLRHNTLNINEGEKKSVSIVQLSNGINQYIGHENLLKKYKKIIDILKNNSSDIIIFGENDYPYLMQFKDITSLQKNLNINQSLIIGSTRKENNKYYNSFFLIKKNSVKIFDKKILVPFGEFIPFRKTFGFMDFITGTIDFTSGKSKRLLNLNENVNIIPIICYEIIYFWKLINSNNMNGNLIINLTNDSWFGKFSGPYQHFYFTKLRAAEFNKDIFRVSTNGISAFINRYGEILSKTSLNEKVIKNINIKLSNEKTNLIFIHNIINILIFLILIIGFFYRKKQ